MTALGSLSISVSQAFADNYAANMGALRPRYPELAEKIDNLAPAPDLGLEQMAPDEYAIGSRSAAVAVTDSPSPRTSARALFDRIGPSSKHQTLLLAGIGLGYRLAEGLDREPPGQSNSRRSFVVIEPSLEVFRLFLLAHDRRREIADPWVHYLVGSDATAQVTELFSSDGTTLPPSLVLFVPPSGDEDFRKAVAATIQSALERVRRELTDVQKRLHEHYVALDDSELLALLSGKSERAPRVLLHTSRYTTFMQFSTRDIKAALSGMGYQTGVDIEPRDGARHTNLSMLRAVDRLRPDLWLEIDHLRHERSFLPGGLPMLSWAQDRLPNIFSAAAGKAVGRRDLVFGFGKPELVAKYGFPENHVIPTIIPTNDDVYHPSPLSDTDAARYGCDASYVSHASADPRAAFEQWVNSTPINPRLRSLLETVFERLREGYRENIFLYRSSKIYDLLHEGEQAAGVALGDAAARDMLADFFLNTINNLFYRQTVLGWLADSGHDLRIYGNGWERHPVLGQFACGPAENGEELRKISQASKINLQIVPYHATHQRLLDGAAAGGFFLVFHNPCDMQKRAIEEVDALLAADKPQSYGAMRAKLSHGSAAYLDEFVTDLKARCGFAPDWTDAVRWFVEWGHESCPQLRLRKFDDMVFRSKDELLAKMDHYLSHEDERRHVAQTTREDVLQHFTYRTCMEKVSKALAELLQSDT